MAAFAIWGLSPLFWKLLVSVPAGQLLSHRVLWAGVMLHDQRRGPRRDLVSIDPPQGLSRPLVQGQDEGLPLVSLVDDQRVAVENVLAVQLQGELSAKEAKFGGRKQVADVLNEVDREVWQESFQSGWSVRRMVDGSRTVAMTPTNARAVNAAV